MLSCYGPHDLPRSLAHRFPAFGLFVLKGPDGRGRQDPGALARGPVPKLTASSV
jgi:hypothetical protein